jgi:predicted 2-oxoglutarate/Fe(II)-dependent dioxygenase YbiX
MAAPGVFVRERFLPGDLLTCLHGHLVAGQGEPAEVQPAPGTDLAVVGRIRRAWEVELPDALHDDVVARLNALAAELADRFEVALSPCEAIAALRYPRGAFYRAHRDRSTQPDAYGLHRRAVSIVIFVNGAERAPGFAGGRLRFHEIGDGARDVLDITPVAGTLVAFPSTALHEVTEVTDGTRLTLVTWLLEAESGL